MAWLAQYMESHDMDIDLRDHCGHTPLHLAARAGHASAVAILVAHGADVTAKVRAEQSYSILVGCPPPLPLPLPAASRRLGVLSHQNPSTATSGALGCCWFIYGTFQSNGDRLRPSNWPRPSPAKR